jgi:uncharacterized protein
MGEDTATGHIRCGIISDTHGMFRSNIIRVFRDVHHIFHSGDIGKPAVLRELETIAPVTAVLGNIDIPAWYPELQKTAIFKIGGKRIMVLHDLNELDLDPAAAEIDIVIHGHTHKPHARNKKDVWYVNPGSAGPHRFMHPVTVAVLEIGDEITVRHIPVQGN